MPERAALIAALILERPMCMDCIVMKAGITRAAAQTYLARIRTVLDFHRDEQDRCRSCGTVGVVFSLARPSR